MTIYDKINSLVSERALLLTSKIFLQDSLIPAEEEKNMIFDYVTNDTLDIGVLDVLSLLAQELKELSNITFNKPDISTGLQLTYSNDLYQKLESVSAKDDNDIYLTSNPSEMNLNSGWIKSNGMGSESFSSSVFYSYIQSILDGLSGLRAERATVDPLNPPNLIHPDFYDDPYKSQIEDNLTNILNKLNTLDGLTETLEEEIDNIPSNFYLSEPDISSLEITELIGFNATIQGLVVTFTNVLTFFTTKAPGGVYNRAEFDAYIGAEGTAETHLSNLIDTVLARITLLKKQFNNTNYGLRKWYVFWINLLIGKPQASLLSYVGIQTALDNTQKALGMKWEQLGTLFGDDYDRYLPTPEVSSVYRDEDANTILLVNALPCFNDFVLYRKKINRNTVLTNDSYLEEDEVDYGDIFLEGLVITDVSDLDEHSMYSYRLSIQDTSTDALPSGSQQSPLLGIQYSYIASGTSLLYIIGGHTLSVGQHIYIDGEGIFIITSKTSSSITIDGEIASSGILRKVNGLIFT